MAANDLTRARVPVSVITEQIFGHLPRADQRHWAQAYLQGLLTTEGKKSVRRIAATVSDSPTASQSMHQFVNASPWEWAPARTELMRWVERRLAPKAWVLEAAVLRKRGDHSCGVHRRFVPETGRSVNCQVGVGAFLTNGTDAVPTDWGLLLPGSWATDEARRSRARVPDGVAHRAIEQHALDLVDSMGAGTHLSTPPIVADLSYHAGAASLVRGLSARGRDFVVAVSGRTPVVPGSHLVAHQPYGGDLPAAVEAQRFFELKTGSHLRMDSIGASREGRPGRASVMTGLVRLPEARTGRQTPHHTYRLFAVRQYAGRRSSRMWLTNMVHRRTEELVALAQLQRRAGATVQTLEQDFGLLDFEGRSYPGWHHHMTLVSVAYAYSRLELPGESAMAAIRTA
ncbi:IS701 family transposase [Streptomyces sp. NPDC002073]|uniref:IS701 family transposase n=1 Tax=Streptomyces sp. NBC_00239 TaxID=2903640 RepID=UPI002E2D798F|nr:transposase [Streptomyces sp. NBC_00239]